MAQSSYLNSSFLLDIPSYVLHQLHIRIGIQWKTLWYESILPSPGFPAVHTYRLGSQPRWAYTHAFGYVASVGTHSGMPINVTHWKCWTCGSDHTWQFSVSILTQCTWAPTKRHSSPVEAVLTGSQVALPGLVEIIIGPLLRMQHY